MDNIQNKWESGRFLPALQRLFKKNFIAMIPKFKLPNSPEAYHQQAKNFLHSSALNKAATAANNAVQLAPTYAEAYHTLALIYFAQGKFVEAIGAGESAIAAVPNYTEAQHTLAQCYFANGQAEIALAKVNAAISLLPEYVEAYFTRGSIYFYLRQLPEAALSFRKALSLKSDYVEAMNYLAEVLQDSDQLQEAESLYRKAIAINPHYTNPHNNLGFLLRQTNRAEEAAKSFKIAHDMFNPEMVVNLPSTKFTITLYLAKKYLRVSLDLIRWSFTRKVKPDTWLNYQLLNQATNGLSGDFFCNVLKKSPKNYNIRPVPKWRNSTVFSWVKENNLPTILETLNRDGIYVFDQLIAPSLLDEIFKFAMTAKADIRPPFISSATRSIASRSVFNPEAPKGGGYQFDESEMLQHSVFQQFLGDPLFLAISQAYLGVKPKFSDLSLCWSTVFARIPSSDMAQIFHCDSSHMKWLKFFVFVTDVTEGSGMHTFVRGSHKRDFEGRALRQRGIVRLSDEDVYKAYGSDKIFNLVGPRGTAFIADTRGFHKGNRHTTSHRLIMQAYLINSFFPDEGKKKWKFTPTHPTLLETIQHQPDAFTAYNMDLQKNE